MKKKFLLVFSLLFLFVSSAFGANPDKDIIILYTNDVHCGIDENIGYAGLSFYRDEMKKISPYVTLVDAGDWSSGGVIGTISKGGYILDIMNKVKYDIAVPGNHEFNFGVKQVMNFAQSMDCGLIACNFRDMRTDSPVLKPYKILEYGNVKIAYIGAVTPDTFTQTTPSFFKDMDGNLIYTFGGEEKGKILYSSIQKAADEARAEGVDYVILAGHLGEYKDVTEHWSAPSVIANTRGIDAVIDGHSHEVTPQLTLKNLDGQDVIISQTGTKLIHIGKMIIHKDGTISSTLINPEDVKGKDENIVKFIDEIKASYESSLSQKLSHTDFILRAKDDNGNWLTRNGENCLCNLIADSIFASAAKTGTGRADIALFNAGGVRTNINSGDITLNDVINVLPNYNYVCMAEVPGQSILDDLEIGVRRLPQLDGGFLHASGMTYTIDLSIPSPVKVDDNRQVISISGDRRICDVFVNGEPLDPNKIYKVISLDYILFANGNGHLFKGAKLIEPNFALHYEILGDYINQFETLPEKYKNPEGRIKIK